MSRTLLAVGSLVADRYRVVAPIGSGASARVLLADDLQLHRRVALKVLHPGLSDDPAFLRRFQAEARAAAALSHPNVMHIYDLGEHDGLPFLVLEFVGGGSLRAVLDQGSVLTPSQAVLMGLGAARGLEYAHRQGFVHRDIKPANLLFDEEGRIRIADFGLARAMAEASWTEPQAGRLGTTRYLSPEQVRGDVLDGRSDVYQLALVLVEAVTGVAPFQREHPEAMALARLDEDLVVPVELGRLRAVVERAGRHDRELRPDAGELEIALLAAAEDMDAPRPIPLPGAIPHDVLDARLAGSSDPTNVGADPDVTQVGAPPVPNAHVAAAPEPEAPEAETMTPSRRVRRRDREATATRRVGIAATLAAIIMAGSALYWLWAVRTPSHALPDVVGEPAAVATRRMAALGFEVSTKLIRRDGTSVDEVVAQQPRPGTDLAEGERVQLTVSLGNTTVPFPVITQEMDEATARGVLTDAGLQVGELTRPNDETVPAGFVISATADLLGAGDLPKGSKVALAISAGPAPRTVPPGLVGQSFDAVAQALQAVQLVPKARLDYSDTVPPGSVVSLNQPDNASVPRGTEVEVVVSKGPKPITVPDVTNRSGVDADAALRAAGLSVAGIEGPPSGRVVITIPAAGTDVQPGTSIRIITQ